MKNRTFLKATILILLLNAIYFLLGGLFANDIFQSIQTAKANFGKCDGIDLFYTGHGFAFDEYNMHSLYKQCYRNDDNLLSELTHLYNPIDSLNCSGKAIDCEDYSYMVNCLANKYDIECRYYIESRSGSIMHAGSECFIDNEWIEVS